jgi:hypothetical protein
MRQRVSAEPVFVPDRRFVEAARQFCAPRFKGLYRLWLLCGNDVLGTPTRRIWWTPLALAPRNLAPAVARRGA